MATYWENSCSFGLRYVSWYKYLIVSLVFFPPRFLEWEGTSRQRSGKGTIRKRFPLQKPRWEKTKLAIRYLYHETIVSRMGSYFPNRWPLSYLNLTKNMKTYIRRQQHKKFLNTKTQNKKNHHRSIDLERSVTQSYWRA